MYKGIIAILAILVLVLAGCGATGNVVLDTDTQDSGETQLTKAGETRVSKKAVCDNTFDDARVKKCYKMFGVTQIIGGDVAE
ncbi:hypothetical protein HN419_02510 [Candidatus Woesearchaeota archaeon]|jgi:hypothetical protein|nr:hypothetical protein [Candidatus Woesearchaeota archaeon]MBT3537131.1 hypothetical protein [Candidatus Woesearchaeota archaeon]MBT4697742.1 hypothetical protein [Candidatus Woesearchaeota archaeon]MBT4716553.1 hypothetical protein [Candidatus Woesearchaeota archaeon]MBT7106559.1 hypothetical protein [Candidatus Woesearchaeota archaeon]